MRSIGAGGRAHRRAANGTACAESGEADAANRLLMPEASMEPTPRVRDETLTLNGLRFHYRDWDNPGAPPVILLHG